MKWTLAAVASAVTGLSVLLVTAALSVEPAIEKPKAGAEPVAAAKDKPATGPSSVKPGPAATQSNSPQPAEPPGDVPAERLPPPKGSHVPADKNNCIICHGESDIWDKSQRNLYISTDRLEKDVHWTAGVNCHDCHGGNYETQEKNQAHAVEDGFRSKYADIKKYCAACHKEQALDLVKGVHDKAGKKNDRGQGTPLECDQCHGKFDHQLLPVRDNKSPVHLENQVKTCGTCHAENQASFLKSVHGQAVEKLGLVVGPACVDCHGSHGIYRAPDQRSTLNVDRVAGTCGKCHRFIDERLQSSVHGSTGPADRLAKREAPGGTTRQKPSCTTCHEGHDLPAPESVAFRERLPGRCGNCHAGLASRYALSIHGELTELGYGPAAKCSDCHGAHDIQPLADPRSRLSPENRAATCQQCHANAGGNFVKFDPHVDYRDGQRYPLVHGVYTVLLVLLFSTFGLFGIHSVLWLVRGLVDVLKRGRPKGLTAGGVAYVRFSTVHRVGHTVMLIAFLGLALTGLPLKFSHSPWAKVVAGIWGGFSSTGFWHRVFGLVVFACFIVYLVRLMLLFWAGRKRRLPIMLLLFGPDSPLPTFHDFKDGFGMVRWLLGLGPKPGFERWTYWEKLDFWGAAADIVIIGFTGLMLWFPNFFCRLLPATALNVAQVVHSTQALLATGFVFAVHFFNTHLRPDKFPADMSVMTGLVSEEEFREERPDLFDRLQREGKLDALRTKGPRAVSLWLVRAGGWLALILGLALLTSMVLAGMGG